MNDKALNLLGLMRKANYIEIGETNTGSAVRDGKARLLLLASDASENAVHRAEGFTNGRNTITVTLPYTKEEISASVGVSGCSMAAITDMGFANALIKTLSEKQPEVYGAVLAETEQRLNKQERRKTETQAHERNKRNGKRRTNI